MGTHKPTTAGARCPVAGCSHEKVLPTASRDGLESAAQGAVPDWLGAVVLRDGEMLPEGMSVGAGMMAGSWETAAFSIPVESGIWAVAFCIPVDDGGSIDDHAAAPRAPTRELAGPRRGVLVRDQMAAPNPGPWGKAAPLRACPCGDVLNVAPAGLGEVSEVAEWLEIEKGESRVHVLVVVEMSAAGRRAQARAGRFDAAGVADAVIRDAARHGNWRPTPVQQRYAARNEFTACAPALSWKTAVLGLFVVSQMPPTAAARRARRFFMVEHLFRSSFHQLQHDKVKMRDNWTAWEWGLVANLVKASGTLLPAPSAPYSALFHCSSSSRKTHMMAMGIVKEMVSGKPEYLIRTLQLSYYTILNLVSRMEGQFTAEHVIRNSFHQFQHQKALPEKNQEITRLENEATLLDSAGEAKMRDNGIDWGLTVVVNLVKKPLSCGTLLPALSALRSTNYIVDTVLHCSSSHVALSEIVQKITRLENEATLLESAEEGKVRDVNMMKNSQASGNGSRSKGCPPHSGEKVEIHVVSRGWTRACVLLASIIMMLLLVSAEAIPDGVCPVNRITSIVDETCPSHQYEPKILIATSEYWIDEYVHTELFQCKRPVLGDESWIQQIDILLQRDDYAETKKEHIVDIAQTKSWQDLIVSAIGLLFNLVTNLGPLIICCQIGKLNDKQKELFVGSTISFLAAHCFWVSYLLGQHSVDIWKCVSSGLAIGLSIGYNIFFWIKIRKRNRKSLICPLACMAVIIVASILTGKFQVIAAGVLGVIFNVFAHIMRFFASGREWNGKAFIIACSGVLSSSLFWHKVDWAVEVYYKIGCLTSSIARGIDVLLLLYYLWKHCTEDRLPTVNNDGGRQRDRHVPNQSTSVANVQATSMDVTPRSSSSVAPKRGIQGNGQGETQALAPHALPPTVPAPRPVDSTPTNPAGTPNAKPPIDHKSDTADDLTSDAVDPKPAAAADLKSSDAADAKQPIAAPEAKPASSADRDSSDATGAKPAEPETSKAG